MALSHSGMQLIRPCGNGPFWISPLFDVYEFNSVKNMAFSFGNQI